MHVLNRGACDIVVPQIANYEVVSIGISEIVGFEVNAPNPVPKPLKA
jgi:hypothetical protein